MRLLLLLALAAAGAYPAAAQDCTTAACSDDPATLGNETLACDASPGATEYQWCTDDEARCAWTIAPTINALGAGLLDGDAFDAREHPFIRIKAKACNDAIHDAPVACSDFTTTMVEFLPYACVKHTSTVPAPTPHCPDCTRVLSCEYRCAPGAPRRLPKLTECQP